MRKLFMLQLILMSTIFSVGAADEGPLSRFSNEQAQRLHGGEVVYTYEEQYATGETPQGAGAAYVIINAPVAKCFEIFTQFDKQYEWLPLLSASDVLESKDNKVTMHNVADLAIMTVDYSYTFTVNYQEHSAHFVTSPEGENDIDFIEGLYLFEKIDDKTTLFTFKIIKLDIGFRVPSLIIKYFSSRNLPEVAENLKKRIESNGVWKKD